TRLAGDGNLRRDDMKRNLQFALAALILLFVRSDVWGQGGEGLGAFRHAVTPLPQADATDEAPTDPWGPVPTEKPSLANLVPGIYPYFNNGTVFGMPGTELGSFWRRTQLSGEWGGLRTDLAQRGIFLDIYTTSAWQDLTSGGLKPGSAFVQNIQYSLNVDTAR